MMEFRERFEDELDEYGYSYRARDRMAGDGAEDEAAIPERRIAPGKVTRTSRIAAMLNKAGAPVQRKAAPVAISPPPYRSSGEDWTRVAFRPDCYDSPVQRSEGGATPAGLGSSGSSGSHPLPAPLQAQMENAFGVDFSAVRVFENSSAAVSVNALAFTQGADIHVAPGHYDPFGSHGQELLGHELTHVVQQAQGRVSTTAQAKGVDINDNSSLEREADIMGARAARGEPARLGPVAISGRAGAVQRKVGFELETSVPIATEAGGLVAKDTPIFQASSGTWTIVAGAGHMEIVTTPFEEEGHVPETQSLASTMSDIESFVDMLKLKGGLAGSAENVPLEAFASSFGTVSRYDGNVIFVPELGESLERFGVTAAPQAIGGFALQDIPMLMDKIVTTKLKLADITGVKVGGTEILPAHKRSDQPKTLTGMIPSHGTYLASARAMATNAVAPLRGVALTEHISDTDILQLEGLTALVISYLLSGAAQPIAYSDSKLIAPLMSRTNFTALCDSLHSEVRKHFTVDFVLTAANMAGERNEPVFAKGFLTAKGIYHGPTRATWIQSIIDGKTGDLISALACPPVTADPRGGSPAMSKYNQLETSLRGQQELALLELRGLSGSQQYTEWKATALAIFKLFRLIRTGRDDIEEIEDMIESGQLEQNAAAGGDTSGSADLDDLFARLSALKAS